MSDTLLSWVLSQLVLDENCRAKYVVDGVASSIRLREVCWALGDDSFEDWVAMTVGFKPPDRQHVESWLYMCAWKCALRGIGRWRRECRLVRNEWVDVIIPALE